MRSAPAAWLLCAVLSAAGMWLYVSRVLVPHQREEAAVLGNPRGNLSDLYPRWLGSRELLLRGRDPYSSEVTREIQIGYYGRPLNTALPNDPHDQEAFAYPVYVAFLLSPTVRLPFAIVQDIMRWTLAALTVLGVALWLRMANWRVSRLAFAPIVIFTLGTFWVVQGIRLQQLTLLVVPLIAGSVVLLIANRQIGSGALLAIATVKPQIALPLVAWLLLWSLGDVRARWKFVSAFSLMLLVLVGAGEVLLPGWTGEFYAALVAYRGYTRHLSPLDELTTPKLGVVLAIVVIVSVAAVCWRARQVSAEDDHFRWTTALVLAANLLVIPTVAPYNQLLLLPGIFLLLRSWKQSWHAHRTSRIVLLLAAGCLIWPLLTATLLAFISFFTPAVRLLWQVPLWTSIPTPIPVTAGLALCLYQYGRRVKLAETPLTIPDTN